MVIIVIALAAAFIGVPVFAVMGGATGLAWLSHEEASLHFVRFIAPDVLDERFTGNPIMVTVPLFTFVGYLMAESNAPMRIVRASTALLGWLPGGLAIVCIVSSAFFTTLTGGSAVTIVAIGALLLPALVERGYPRSYALGLVMTGGSLGLLLPPSIPVIVYSFVAGVDFTKTFKALLLPGAIVMLVLSAHAMFVAWRSGIPRARPNLREMASALWVIKWEAGIPCVIFGALASGLAQIDEVAALAAAYVVVVEVFVHRDVPLSALPRAIKNAVALAGAVMLIMALAMGLTNFLINEQVPMAIFEALTSLGVTETWHFLLVLNVFLYVQGMLMDGFSAIFVAVPLLIPFAASFSLSPFHLAAMFLLNLEIAYLSPPLGQNLFVSSFRFRTPMVRLYRIAIPFVGVLIVSLAVIMAFPRLSTLAIEPEIQATRRAAIARGDVPRQSFSLQCVQADRNDPKPCTFEDRTRWPEGETEDFDIIFE